MSKIVIIGTTASGKTCYFYGMLRKLQRGVSGFSIRINEKSNYNKLREGMLKLGDTRLPLDERWPEATSAVETFKLDLMHNLRQLDSIDWVDYPGEHVLTMENAFIEQLNGADCLFVCVDGSKLAFDVERYESIEDELADIEEELAEDGTTADVFRNVPGGVSKELLERYGEDRCAVLTQYLINKSDDFDQQSGMDLCNALAHAEKAATEKAAKDENARKDLPTICILVTKADTLPEMLKDMDLLKLFLQLCFPSLFYPGKGNHRDVSICPVTLGKDISTGGKLHPKNVERPICLAAYLMQLAACKELGINVDNFINHHEQQAQAYNNAGFIGRIIRPKPRVLSEEEKATLRTLVESANEDLNELREMISVVPRYIDGIKSSWAD